MLLIDKLNWNFDLPVEIRKVVRNEITITRDNKKYNPQNLRPFIISKLEPRIFIKIDPREFESQEIFNFWFNENYSGLQDGEYYLVGHAERLGKGISKKMRGRWEHLKPRPWRYVYHFTFREGKIETVIPTSKGRGKKVKRFNYKSKLKGKRPRRIFALNQYFWLKDRNRIAEETYD